jgi:hypothetical protein
MAVIAEPERTKLYTRIRHLLGAPLRSIEIEDEMMDSLLELSISDYSQYVQDWLIESQWTSLYNLNLDTQSLSRAFITKSLDYETRYTYAYSKIVGLQAGGDWELKKDFVELVPNQQIYEIPANREINEVMWFTPAELPDNKYFIFGEGGTKRLAESLNLPVIGEIPLIQSIREAGDVGRPSVLQDNTAAARYWQAFLINFEKELRLLPFRKPATQE